VNELSDCLGGCSLGATGCRGACPGDRSLTILL
jgi:hypothetical protein